MACRTCFRVGSFSCYQIQLFKKNCVFSGWGGEDDDLYGRLVGKNIEICRFEQTYSLYTMLKHKPEKPNVDRLAFLRDGPTRYHSDGLNSLVFKEVAFKLTKLYTHILVET
jgi:N-terminal domain of galactosyltransferase